MPYILQTNQLTKVIGGKNLVTNVSMHVKKGEVYGFLGPNGAGKTTVMKMLTNLWKPTEGSIELFGQKLTPTSYEVLKRMGSIIEFPTFYDHLSGTENLALHCEYMGYYNPGSIENAYLSTMCVFETQDRTDMIGQIRQVMPHIKDSDMEELGEQVLGKLQKMTDEEFAEITLEVVE